ncbi:hypothetical protein HF086_006013 [Spodoptera exigua]|uniref:Envelope fusion protein n=1 Tax=Spodoptera exigua TaxID=7107 RepID=A0A922SNR4_SPOEX|nr:hypothetical protein HF086_006013 [Spodoptera exigua]
MIERFMEETKTNLVSIETEIQIAMATSYFNSAALTASLLLRNLREIQTMLLNTLTNVYSGHMDVHLIPPVNLVKQLEDIAGKLPRTLSLPTENIKEDIKELYKLLYVKARITMNYFMFEVHIPLISDEEFTYYRAIAIPFKRDSNYKQMQLSSQYIAVNFEKNSYISLKDEDVKQCIKGQKHNFICTANMPVFNLHNKMHRAKQNSWVTVLLRHRVTYIACHARRTGSSYMNQTAGLLFVAEGCVLRSKDLTITSHNQYNSNLNVNYDMHVLHLNSPINNIVNVTLHNTPHDLFHLKNNDFAEIDKKLRFQEEHEPKLPSTITDHDVHQYVICYLLLTIAVITFLLIMTRKYCMVLKTRVPRKKNKKPIHEDIELQPMGSQQQSVREDNQRSPTDGCDVQRQGHQDNIAFTFN